MVSKPLRKGKLESESDDSELVDDSEDVDDSELDGESELEGESEEVDDDDELDEQQENLQKELYSGKVLAKQAMRIKQESHAKKARGNSRHKGMELPGWKTFPRPSPSAAASTEEALLRAAIGEQDRALLEMKSDLKVLRQVHTLFSMSEEDARRQGIKGSDLLLVNAFDDEDAGMVSSTIEKVDAMVQALERDFGDQVRSYETTVSSMREILETRASVINKLDSSTGVFSRYPDLSKFITEKQGKLAQSLEQTQKALLDGFASSLAKVKLTQGQLNRAMAGKA
jgi:hypothetical protein